MIGNKSNFQIKLLSISLFFAISHPCGAGTVDAVITDAGAVKISTQQATFDEILDTLSEKYNFKIERNEATTAGGPVITAKFEGQLDSVLKRLLRNHNYLIVRRQDDPSQIQKIVILSNRVGAPTPKPPSMKKKPSDSPAPDGA